MDVSFDTSKWPNMLLIASSFFLRGSKTASAKGATAGATEASAAARQDDVQ